MAKLALTQRLDLHGTDPAAYAPMLALEKYVHGGTLGEAVISLMKLRASQINGCAYCLNMHAEEARKAGVDEQRIAVLSAWREAPDIYNEREQAALAFTEEVTRISEHGVSEDTWARVRAAFDDKEIAHLLMGINAINCWNRMAIATHLPLPARKH